MVRNRMRVHYFFKLFNSVKEKHEVDFAELEITNLFGEIERVRNVMAILEKDGFSAFKGDAFRIQDILTHELPYGDCQGFYGTKSGIQDVTEMVKRLAYTREFLMISKSVKESEKLLSEVFPQGKLEKNVQYFRNGNHFLFRFITHQYFLEKSQYISKLSRNEAEVDNNVTALFEFLTKKLYRIPATSTMRVGKRLEDYFTIREEPSLYLTHYMHPYKGRYHPKMVRALLNYIYPQEKGRIMDNFAGCGTLLVEATWMGLDNAGVEINPLSVLMCNVKCHALSLNPSQLKKQIMKFLRTVSSALSSYEQQATGSSLLVKPTYNLETIEKQKQKIPAKVIKKFKNKKAIDKVLIAYEIVKLLKNEKIKNFILLALSGTISDLTRRRSAEFIDVLKGRLTDLYLRVYLFKKLNETLKIELGTSETYVGDTRDMKNSCKTLDRKDVKIENSSIDGIVNSPPYSTALDYVKNDLPQLAILNLAESFEQLEIDMIGNPKPKYYPKELVTEIETNHKDFERLPATAKKIITKLLKNDRVKTGIRTYKFYKDMYKSLEEMSRVMKQHSKCTIVIGNNNYKLSNNKYFEVKNDEVIWEIAEKPEIGLIRDKVITRELEKTRAGMIRYESIVILKKE